MLRLNRMTEYGLMALQHMSRKLKPELTSAREVANCYGLPFDITAKTLQKLKEAGLVQSIAGVQGGYFLLRPLNQISLAEFLELMEGPQAMVACAEENAHLCSYQPSCQIHSFMNRVNTRVFQFLSEIFLTDLSPERNL